MKHMRMIETKDETFQIGDVLQFTMKDGEEAEAMAVKQEPDGTVFCFVDCLSYESNMTNGGAYHYEKSIVRGLLNGTVLDSFPDDLRKDMIPFANGDYLRIPTEKEIFGKNEYGEGEPDEVRQFEPMKLNRNRIAMMGHNGYCAWYWLQNRSVYSATRAALVNGDGGATRWNASGVLAVRPLFKIKNP